MATDRADVVCAPNGQTPINRCSAKLDFGGHQSRKGLFVGLFQMRTPDDYRWCVKGHGPWRRTDFEFIFNFRRNEYAKILLLNERSVSNKNRR